MRSTIPLAAATLALAFAASAATAATAERFTSFFAFGDSLTDAGNLYVATGNTIPASPPYFNGRFSNGPIWADIVADDFEGAGLATGNFAYATANAITNADAVPDLPTQLALFGGTVPVDTVGDRPLVSLWFGNNDVFDAVDALLSTAAVEAVAIAAAQAVAQAALALATSPFAVTDFLIFNIPDLGRIPAYALFDGDLVDEATAGALAFNAQIATEIDGLRALGLNVIEVDSYGFFNDLLDDPAAFGVANADIPCVIPGLSVCTAAQAQALAFFDPVHPNATIHAAIADVVRTSVAPVPLPMPAALLATGLLGLVTVARRRA